jgi:hypothetical protein
MSSDFVMVGGTGIEPATCGFGDPIRRVGGCHTLSPYAALPHSRCRLMSPSVAGCRRSLGQILGQPILPRALFSLPSSSRSGTQSPDGWADPAAVPRRASAFRESCGAATSQVEAPPTVPFRSSRLLADYTCAPHSSHDSCEFNRIAPERQSTATHLHPYCQLSIRYCAAGSRG